MSESKSAVSSLEEMEENSLASLESESKTGDANSKMGLLLEETSLDLMMKNAKKPNDGKVVDDEGTLGEEEATLMTLGADDEGTIGEGTHGEEGTQGEEGLGESEEEEEDDFAVPNVKRTALLEATTDIIMLRRANNAKISIEIPPFKQRVRRLNRVYLSNSKFVHMLHEAIGGKYGLPSRPDLETQKIFLKAEHKGEDKVERKGEDKVEHKGEDKVERNGEDKVERNGEDKVERKGEDEEVSTLNRSETKDSADNDSVAEEKKSTFASLGITHLTVIYDSSRMCYVISRRLETKLLAFLREFPNELGDIEEALIRNGSVTTPVMSMEKQRFWRRFVRLYIMPLLKNAERMSKVDTELAKEHPFSPEEDELGSSDEEKDVDEANYFSDSDISKGSYKSYKIKTHTKTKAGVKADGTKSKKIQRKQSVMKPSAKKKVVTSKKDKISKSK